jgi:hypothetical protein
VLAESAGSSAQSLHLGVNSESIGVMRKLGEVAHHDGESALIMRGHSMYLFTKAIASKKNVTYESEEAMQSFLYRSSCYRFSRMCMAFHPVVMISKISLLDTRSMQAWLLVVRIMGAAAASALFYNMSALPKNMAKHLADSCADAGGTWVNNLVVGILSTLMSDGAMYFLMGIRGPPYPELAILDGTELHAFFTGLLKVV